MPLVRFRSAALSPLRAPSLPYSQWRISGGEVLQDLEELEDWNVVPDREGAELAAAAQAGR